MDGPFGTLAVGTGAEGDGLGDQGLERQNLVLLESLDERDEMGLAGGLGTMGLDQRCLVEPTLQDSQLAVLLLDLLFGNQEGVLTGDGFFQGFFHGVFTFHAPVISQGSCFVNYLSEEIMDVVVSVVGDIN